MSNQKNAVTIAPAVEAPATSYHEAAQAFLEELRRMREKIPHFAIPAVKGRQRLSTVKSLPPEFIELAAAVRANHPALVRGAETTPAESRDLTAYAEAFVPVAQELLAMNQFVLFSIDAAKGKAGTEALMTYAVSRRLAKRPEHADLIPHVAALRRAFGNRGKRSKAAKEPAQTPAPTSDEK
jgi:hypothetical protein